MSRIVYLHGFASGPGSSKARYLGARLEAAGARVDIPDLSAGDFEHLTITGQLAVLESGAHGEPVALVGSSMGGYLAALYASRHPEVTRLVLLAPAFGFARRWPQRIGSEAMEQWRSTGAMDVYHYGAGRMCSLSYRLMEDAGRYEDNPDFKQPALIFHGEHDDVVPADLSRAFAETHSNVDLEIVDSGHELLNVLEYMAPKIVDFMVRPQMNTDQHR